MALYIYFKQSRSKGSAGKLNQVNIPILNEFMNRKFLWKEFGIAGDEYDNINPEWFQTIVAVANAESRVQSEAMNAK